MGQLLLGARPLSLASLRGSETYTLLDTLKRGIRVRRINGLQRGLQTPFVTTLGSQPEDLADRGFAEVMGPGEFVQAHPLLATPMDRLTVHQ